jgi:hypothetical protein
VPGDLTVWARHLSDGSIAVALYNEDNSARAIGVPSFAALGWPYKQQASIRDLWAHTVTMAPRCGQGRERHRGSACDGPAATHSDHLIT